MLEDNHEDIIAKAMRGQKIGKSMLADLSSLEKTEVESLLKRVNFLKKPFWK